MLITMFVLDQDNKFVEMRQMIQHKFEKEFNCPFYHRDDIYDGAYWDASRDMVMNWVAYANLYMANQFLINNRVYDEMDSDAWIELLNDLYAAYKED